METLEEMIVDDVESPRRKPPAFTRFGPLKAAATQKPREPLPAILLAFRMRRDLNCLGEILQELPWRKIEVRSFRDAAARLYQHRIPIIVTERSLPDGDWKDLLQLVSGWPVPPSIIVSAPWADERLWAEVLNVGGYDVLAQPFEKLEVMRVLLSAWMQWKSQYDARLERAAARAAAG